MALAERRRKERKTIIIGTIEDIGEAEVIVEAGAEVEVTLLVAAAGQVRKRAIRRRSDG